MDTPSQIDEVEETTTLFARVEGLIDSLRRVEDGADLLQADAGTIASDLQALVDLAKAGAVAAPHR